VLANVNAFADRYLPLDRIVFITRVSLVISHARCRYAIGNRPCVTCHLPRNSISTCHLSSPVVSGQMVMHFFIIHQCWVLETASIHIALPTLTDLRFETLHINYTINGRNVMMSSSARQPIKIKTRKRKRPASSKVT